MFRKIIAFCVVFCLVFEQSGFAQVSPQVNIPAYLAGYLSPDRFRPIHLRSISFDDNSRNFDLLLDKGDVKKPSSGQIEDTTRRLFTYFRIGLNLPNSMFWVNLRPDDPANIIDPYVEKTDLGKVLLEADLQLKKDMAACTSPDTKEGRAYWNRLYARAEILFGQSDIEVPTVTRPWIVPGEIIMAQSRDSAYVYKATLKVMLEQDYLKDARGYDPGDSRLKELNEYSSRIIREEILPKLTREVNSAKRYASLRQVYYSLILAQWYKQSDRSALLSEGIDSKDLTGLASKQKWSKYEYYKAYKRSFERGEYNKEEAVSGRAGLTIRRYFSGGIRIAVPRIEGLVMDVRAVNGLHGNIGARIDPVTLSTSILNSEEMDAEKDGGWQIKETAVTAAFIGSLIFGPVALLVTKMLELNDLLEWESAAFILFSTGLGVAVHYIQTHDKAVSADGSSAAAAKELKDGGTHKRADGDKMILLEKVLRPVYVFQYLRQLKDGQSAGEDAARQLGRFGDTRAVAPLKDYIRSNIERDRDTYNRAAEGSLSRLGVGEEEIEELYIGFLSHASWHVQRQAALRLTDIGGVRALAALHNESIKIVIERNPMAVWLKRDFQNAIDAITARQGAVERTAREQAKSAFDTLKQLTAAAAGSSGARLIKPSADEPLIVRVDDESVIVTQEDIDEIKKKLPLVLKEYDIRGNDEYFTPQMLVVLGLALGTARFESHHGVEGLDPGDIFIIGGDNGPTTPKMRKYLAAGLCASGVTVMDLGTCVSGQLYTSVSRLGLQGGFYVTRSHVEVGVNGFKPIVGKTTLYGDMIQNIGARIDRGLRVVGENYQGTIIKEDSFRQLIRDAYIESLKKEFSDMLGHLTAADMKIAVDFGGGSATEYVDFVKEMLGDKLVAEFRAASDPTCTLGLPDPSRGDDKCLGHPGSAGTESVLDWSKANPDVVVFSFDLDTDRIGIVIGGKLYKGDELFYPVVEYALATYGSRHKEFYYDARMTPAIAELVTNLGGTAKIHPKGHSKIKATVEKYMKPLASSTGFRSEEEMAEKTGYKNYQMEYSLHAFVTTDTAACIDDAMRFMFVWLEAFDAIRKKHDQPRWLLEDYINDLTRRDIISEWSSLSEQRTGMQEQYKKELMNDLRDAVLAAFGTTPSFKNVPWTEFQGADSAFTLVDIDGVYYFMTPLGIFYWGWSNTSEKIAFGAHALSAGNLRLLVEPMLAAYLRLRAAKEGLNAKSAQIEAQETKGLLDLFNAGDIGVLEGRLMEKYPSVEAALDSLKDGGSERIGESIVAPEGEVLEKVADSIRPYTSKGRVALVVDPDDSSRNATAGLFRKLGFETKMVTSAAEAYRAWEIRHFDIISVNGDLRDLWLAERIRERNGSVPLLYHADFSRPGTADRIHRAHVDGLVTGIVRRDNEGIELPLAVRSIAAVLSSKDGGEKLGAESQRRAAKLAVFLKEEFAHYADYVCIMSNSIENKPREEVMRDILDNNYDLLDFYEQISMKLAIDHNVIKTTRSGPAQWQMLTVLEDIFIVSFNMDVPGEISVRVEKTGSVPAEQSGSAGRDGGDDAVYSERFVRSLAEDLMAARADRTVDVSISERILRFLRVYREVQKDLDDPRRFRTSNVRGALRTNMPLFSNVVMDVAQDDDLRLNVGKLMLLVPDDHRVFDAFLNVVTSEKGNDTVVRGVAPMFADMRLDLDQMHQLAQAVRALDGGNFWMHTADQNFIEKHHRMPLASGSRSKGAVHGYVVVIDPGSDLGAYEEHIRLLNEGTFTAEESRRLLRNGIDPAIYSKEKNARLPVIVYVQEADPSYDRIIVLADGVIQARGGITSHGFKVCIDLEIPVVTDVKNLMVRGRPAETGDILTLDANNGRVYEYPADQRQAIPLINTTLALGLAQVENAFMAWVNREVERINKAKAEAGSETGAPASGKENAGSIIPQGLREGRKMVIKMSTASLPAEAISAYAERVSKINNKEATIVFADRRYNEIDILVDNKMYLIDWNMKGVYTLMDPETGDVFVSGFAAADGGSPQSFGGIDLRTLPVSQPAGPAMLSVAVSDKDAQPMTAQELDAQWEFIEKSIRTGPVPYGRLKAHAVACCRNAHAADQRAKLAAYIENLLKLEEEAAVPTAPELKEVLVVLS